MSAFGDALTDLLAQRNMSQNELARRIGISSAAVNQWATGKSSPTRDNVERVEDELAITPRGQLLHAAGYINDRSTEPSVESLLRSDPGLDAEDKRVFLRLIRLARERHAQAD